MAKRPDREKEKRPRAQTSKAAALRRRREVLDTLLKVLRGS
jgi:hypothetical protein